MDRKTQEQAVWQRVLAGPGSARGDLAGLYQEALAGEAQWRYLAQRLGEGARGLWEESQRETAALRGMLRRAGLPEPRVRIPAVTGPAEGVLLGCYDRARKASAEYTARWGDPEFGAAFRRMTEEKEGQCLKILVLLGTLRKS